MSKENQKLGEMNDQWNTDKVLSSEEEMALKLEESLVLDAYAEKVKNGELKMERAFDKDGKLLSVTVREKDTPEGLPGKIVFFRDENEDKAVRDYNQKFTPPKPRA